MKELKEIPYVIVSTPDQLKKVLRELMIEFKEELINELDFRNPEELLDTAEAAKFLGLNSKNKSSISAMMSNLKNPKLHNPPLVAYNSLGGIKYKIKDLLEFQEAKRRSRGKL